jgi:hypothetical protein
MDGAHRNQESSSDRLEVIFTAPVKTGGECHTDLQARSLIGIQVSNDEPTYNPAFHVRGAGIADDAAMTRPSLHLVRSHSGFSFEPGDDDIGLLLNEPTGGKGCVEQRYLDQIRSYSASESLESSAIETSKRHAGDATSLTKGLICKSTEPTKGGRQS